MSKPIISIVIAVFNGEGTLQKCIDSVVGQGYPDKELVIMDGGSTDKTIEILNANDKCIDYWESMADRGISHAWNKGLERTQGEWIIFLGADDFLADNHVLERACKHLILAKRENKYIAYGQVDLVNEKGILLERRGIPV